MQKIIAICSVVLLTACSNDLYRSDVTSIEEGKWYAGEEVKMSLDIQDTASAYDYYVILRNTEDYPYQNIYLFMDLTFPNDRKLIDTVGVDLAYPDGKWKGKGAGGVYDSRIMVKRKKKFPLRGEYTFSIRQGMRDDILTGIEAVGIELAYSKNK